MLEVPGFEADDVLGTVVDRARARDLDVVLVTSDKDMLQLVGPRVRVLAPGQRAASRFSTTRTRCARSGAWGPSKSPISSR